MLLLRLLISRQEICQTQARIAIRGLTITKVMNMSCPEGVKCNRARTSDFSGTAVLSNMSQLVKSYSDLQNDNYQVALSICAMGSTMVECNKYCSKDCEPQNLGRVYYQEFINRINQSSAQMEISGSYDFVCPSVRQKPKTLGLESWKVALICISITFFIAITLWIMYGSSQFFLEKYRERANKMLLKETGEKIKPSSGTRAARIV